MLTIKNKNTKALIILNIVFLVVMIVNFSWGKYFTGWDAVNPEFNFWVNFKRTLFAFWQENYGLGTIAGHGFAALLPHAIITFLFSIVLPQWSIRIIFTFFCLYVGTLGMFFLAKLILEKLEYNKERHSILHNIIKENSAYLALASSLFYMLNLATVQMFYVQLEAFIVHFATLPWLFWIVIRLLDKRTKKNLILFVIINFFASVQAFIPSLFVAYMTALGIFLIVYLLHNKLSLKHIKNAVLIIILTIIVNLYWLFPFSQYILTQNKTFLNSYNNLQSTQSFIDVNKKYGGLSNTTLLKGYEFDLVQFDEPVLKPWIDHFTNPLVKTIGYSFFILIVIGIIAALKFFQNWIVRGFIAISIFFFSSMNTGMFPFSLLTEILQRISPTYQQAFRTAFTKFSIGTAFGDSIFFSLGLLFCLYFLYKSIKSKWTVTIFYLVVILALFFISLPTFKGNLFYKKLFVNIPKAYFEIFDYFGKQSDGRIADFPQDCSDGWYNYQWGYIGSGFYWYAIKQPFVSRTFDVWSNNNENYYWEISQAIREKNYSKVDAVFKKYNIRWILYDPNIRHCRDQKAFFEFDDFVKYLQDSDNYTLVKTFSSENALPIKLFENNDTEKTASFIKGSLNLPNVGPTYKWNDNDRSFYDLGDYQTNTDKEYGIYYPFRSLFNKRKAEEKEYSVKSLNDWIIFGTEIPPNLQNQTLQIKNYSQIEKALPISLKLNKSAGSQYRILISYIFPIISLDSTKMLDYQPSYQIGTLPISIKNTDQIRIFINGIEVDKQKEQSEFKDFVNVSLNNKIEILNQNNLLLFSWNSENDPSFQDITNKNFTIVLPDYKEGELTVTVPKIKGILINSGLDNNPPQACDGKPADTNNKYEIGKDQGMEFIRLFSTNSKECLIYNFDQVPASYAHLLEINSRNISGSNPQFYIYDREGKRYLDLNLNDTQLFSSSTYLLPPVAEGELGYFLHFVNSPSSDKATINDFGDLSLWQTPYEFLKTMNVQKEDNNILLADSNEPILKVTHPNETFYKVEITKKTNFLILYQSFHSGWKAYADGKEIKDHILVNNWANGWDISNIQHPTSITLTFWPQYLEFAGFGLMFFALLIIILKRD